MKVRDFENTLRAIPEYVAVFKLTKVPVWLKGTLEAGDILCYEHQALVSPKTGKRYGIGASYVSFVEYLEYSKAKALFADSK